MGKVLWPGEGYTDSPARMQYTAQEMLSQARRGTKHTPAQTYFNVSKHFPVLEPKPTSM